MRLNDFKQELLKILPEESIISDIDRLEKYSEDRSTIYRKIPELVVIPTNTREIIEVVKLCNKNKIGIVPWGAGTSVTGASIATDNSIILSLEKFNKIEEIDEENLIAVVQPGVLTYELKEKVKEFNLFYPPDPASFESSTIGGNVSTNAGGATTVKYGVTKDYVTGLEVVLGSGIFEKFGGKCVKNSSGYHLKDLFIGAEGTLGIITKIYLKLLPFPKFIISIYATFNSLFNLFKAVNEIFKSGILPTSLEYMDDTVLKYLNKKFNLPDKSAKASILIQLDGNDLNSLENEINEIYKIVSKIEGFINLYYLENPLKEREIWNARRQIGEILKENSLKILKADIVVPRGCVKDIIPEIKSFGENYKIETACFGHAGDGNIHVNFLVQNKLNEERIIEGLYSIVKKYEGFPSGEHGIGLYKKKILKNFLGEHQINLMKKIKSIFDPNSIMNPGKVF